MRSRHPSNQWSRRPDKQDGDWLAQQQKGRRYKQKQQMLNHVRGKELQAERIDWRYQRQQNAQ
jgi:hypothetical protein